MLKISLLAMVAASAPAGQTTPPDSPAVCPRPAAPPPELSGWATMAPARAAVTDAGATVLPIGTGVRVTLLPTPFISYRLAPERPGTPASSGGLLAIDVGQAGRYRVALGEAAWIDMVRDGRMVASAAHGHGPACSGIRKMVDFDLAPGRHLLQIAGSGTVTIPMMVVRLPR